MTPEQTLENFIRGLPGENGERISPDEALTALAQTAPVEIYSPAAARIVEETREFFPQQLEGLIGTHLLGPDGTNWVFRTFNLGNRVPYEIRTDLLSTPDFERCEQLADQFLSQFREWIGPEPKARTPYGSEKPRVLCWRELPNFRRYYDAATRSTNIVLWCRFTFEGWTMEIRTGALFGTPDCQLAKLMDHDQFAELGGPRFID